MQHAEPVTLQAAYPGQLAWLHSRQRYNFSWVARSDAPKRTVSECALCRASVQLGTTRISPFFHSNCMPPICEFPSPSTTTRIVPSVERRADVLNPAGSNCIHVAMV